VEKIDSKNELKKPNIKL